MSRMDAARTLDRDALVNLFDLYSHPLYDYAFRMCSDPGRADRIVGDAFASLLKQLAGGKESIQDLRSYLYKVTYQLIMEIQKDPARGPSRTGSPPVNCWEELTVEQQHIIILRYLEGLSRTETASIMGKKVHQVRSMEVRAVDILRRTLDVEEVM